MQLKEFVRKKTWLALLTFHLVVVLLCAIGSFLILQGLLPMSTAKTILRIAWFLAAFIAVRIAAADASNPLLITGLLLLLVYLSIHAMSLLLSEQPLMGGWGLDAVIAMLAGAILSRIIWGGGKKKKKRNSRTKDRKRSVT